MIYEPFDVVVVPFPFTDSIQTKRRPALVLSQNEHFGNEIQHSVLAMITSQKNAPWPLDCPVRYKKQCLLLITGLFLGRSDIYQKQIKTKFRQVFPNYFRTYSFCF